MSTFVVCEAARHVDEARRREPRATIVAVTPDSAWHCQRLGVRYVRFDEFVPDAEVNALGDAMTEAEYGWAAWMDDVLPTLVPEVAAPGFTPARAQLYYVKRALDAYIRPAWMLRRFAVAARPARLVLFERRPYYYPRFALVPGRPYYGWLGPAVAGQLTEIDLWPDAGDEAAPVTEAARSGAVQRLAPGTVRRRLARAVRSLKAHLPGPRVAWVARGYDWEHVVPLLEQDGVRVLECSERVVVGRGRRAPPSEDLARRFRETWPSLRTSPELWAPIDAVTPDLRAPVEPFLRAVWETETPRAWSLFQDARAWLDHRRIDATVSVDIQSPFMGAAMMAAKALGIPRVMSVHTPPAGAADLPVQDVVGPLQSDVYLVNGTGDEAYFAALAARLGTFERARVVSAGSARVERLTIGADGLALRARLSATDARPVVLYVPTAFEGHQRYFNAGHMCDVAYLELQQRILRRLAAHPRVRVLYKPHALDTTGGVLADFIAAHAPNAELISTRVTEVMWVADAVIIDFPSTALAEVSMTDRPLLVYAGRDWGRLLPLAKAALAKRARVSESPDEFDAHVRDFLDAGDFRPVERPDSEFRRLFVTHLDDGRSASRAAAAVRQTVAMAS